MRIVLTGGGSGGHITPFGPIIEALRTLHNEQKETLPARIEPKKLEISFMGVASRQARELFTAYSVPVIHIPSGKLRRYLSVYTVADICVKLPVGMFKALISMWRIMPDVVISKGGYGSIPAILAASFYRIPSLIHESDAIMGISNKLIARFTSAIAVGFPNSSHYPKEYAYKTFATGTPVRSVSSTFGKEQAKASFGIPTNEFVLLVMGGSQGAQQINEALLSVLPDIIVNVAVLHICGDAHYKAVTTVSREILEHSPRKTLYKVFPRLSDKMEYALTAADAVVSRAGASSLSEIAQHRIPALIVPLEGSANDHQRRNAESFEATGGILVLDPTNMGRNLFKLNLERILTDEDLRGKLTNNLPSLDYPNAARDIASLALKLASGYAPQKPPEKKN